MFFILFSQGPGTIAEAMILGLPLVLSTFLPGQEEGNVPYVVNGGFGRFSGEDPAAIATTVAELLNDPPLLQVMAAKAMKLSLPGATLAIAKDLAELCLQGAQGKQHLDGGVIDGYF